MNSESRKPEESIDQTQLACLLASLNEVQQTIRSYDLKAQIMGVGFIFSVAMIGRFLENLEVEREFGLGYLIVGFLLLIGPVILYGSVLYPTRRTAPKTMPNSIPVHHCFYFRSDGGKSHEQFQKDIETADWKSELTYEIIRLSALRDLKRKRFLMAMFVSGASFAIILVAEFSKLIGVT